MTTAHAQSGFTLVEAMVSLFVFALVAVGCVTMLAQGADTQGRVGAAERSLRDLQATRALLASDVAQITPGPVGALSETFGGFEGVGAGAAADRYIVLVRSAGDPDPASPLATSLLAVEYRIDGEGRLVRRTRDALLPGPDARTRDRLLLAGARDIRFEFHDGLTWRTDWSSRGGAVPQAVAIRAILPRYGDVRLSAYAGLK